MRLRLSQVAMALPLFAIPALAQRTPPVVFVSAENPLAIERRDEIVSVPWNRVLAEIPSATSTSVRVREGGSGREMVSQVIDNDGDGKPDEFLFLADFWPKQRLSFSVEGVAPSAKPQPRVFIRHDDPRDDVAWESDRIAFRIYGEGLKKTSSAMSSNGIDVWPKSVHTLVVEKRYGKEIGVDVRNSDGLIVLSDMRTGLWLFRMDGFSEWNGQAAGMPNISSVQDYDHGPAGAPGGGGSR